jgi:putative hydrolase of the HAD superfamily
MQLFFSDMQKISNIIFDFGNVLLDIDPPRTWKGFEFVFGDSYAEVQQMVTAENLFDRFEMGLMPESEFVAALCAASHREVAPETIVDIWNAMLLRQPLHRLQMLLNLRAAGYQVYLLSNTNETHIRWVRRHLAELGVKDFEETYFTKAYYSHDVKMRKPNADIFEFVLSDAGIRADESLFIDDLEANVRTAATLGLQTIHHDPNEEIEIVLKNILDWSKNIFLSTKQIIPLWCVLTELSITRLFLFQST